MNIVGFALLQITTYNSKIQTRQGLGRDRDSELEASRLELRPEI
jgi:hypothetical protein